MCTLVIEVPNIFRRFDVNSLVRAQICDRTDALLQKKKALALCNEKASGYATMMKRQYEFHAENYCLRHSPTPSITLTKEGPAMFSGRTWNRSDKSMRAPEVKRYLTQSALSDAKATCRAVSP